MLKHFANLSTQWYTKQLSTFNPLLFIYSLTSAYSSLLSILSCLFWTLSLPRIITSNLQIFSEICFILSMNLGLVKNDDILFICMKQCAGNNKRVCQSFWDEDTSKKTSNFVSPQRHANNETITPHILHSQLCWCCFSL